MKEELPLTATSFGLTTKYITNVYDVLIAMRQAGWEFKELYGFPVGLRDYICEKQLDPEKAS